MGFHKKKEYLGNFLKKESILVNCESGLFQEVCVNGKEKKAVLIEKLLTICYSLADTPCFPSCFL